VSIDPEEEAAAIGALWSWYLEWSGIARVAIKDRRVLRMLGFLRTRAAASEEDADERRARKLGAAPRSPAPLGDSKKPLRAPETAAAYPGDAPSARRASVRSVDFKRDPGAMPSGSCVSSLRATR
jgi:hypothetical protein